MAEKTRTTASSAAPTTPNPKNWSELPKKSLIGIARLLDYTTDLPRFRGVCTGWRKNLPLNEITKITSGFQVSKLKIPALDLNPLIFKESRFYFLSHVSPDFTPHLHGKWLVRCGRANNIVSFLYHLHNPLNLDDYFFYKPPIMGAMNLCNCHVLELARPVSLIGGQQGPEDDDAHALSEKVVGGLDPGSAHMFSVLAQLYEGELIFWRMRDKDWTKIKGTFNNGGLLIFDIVYYNRKYYAFSFLDWKVGLLDPAKPDPVSMEFTINGPDIIGGVVDCAFTVLVDGVHYNVKDVKFVVSYDKTKLYLVIEANHLYSKKGRLFVYVLTKEEKWDRVRKLDEILFIGFDVTFSMPSSELPQWYPGTICLFTKPYPLSLEVYDRSKGKELPEGMEGVKSMEYADYWRYFRKYDVDEKEDETNERIMGFGELPLDEYMALFFPPPGWVKWICPLGGGLDEFSLQGLKFEGQMQMEAMLKAMDLTDEEYQAQLSVDLMQTWADRD